MSLQSEASQWVSWSLEQVALILGRRFPDRYIWVVRASRLYLHKFSCYQNFVESSVFGAPEHSGYSECGAFQQLRLDPLIWIILFYVNPLNQNRFCQQNSAE